MSMTTELALLVSKAKASIFTMKYISQFEASDIDSDDVDLRFEVDGVETGTNVSIVDECGQAAQMITALVEALEAAEKRNAELEVRAVKLPEPFKMAKSSSGLTYYYADEINEALTAAGIEWEEQ